MASWHYNVGFALPDNELEDSTLGQTTFTHFGRDRAQNRMRERSRKA